MKTTLNAETLKNSGNLHAIFNVADLQIIDDYWINTTIYELIGNFDKLTVKSYTIDDDFNVNFEAENEPIKAEIFSRGSIFISPEMVKSIISSNGETVEIFQDCHQIVFYIDGKSRYFFDADFLDDIENKRIEKEEEEENARREWIEKQDEKYTRSNVPEKPTSIILNPCEIFKGIAHCFDKYTSATIENGFLTVYGEKGIAYRNIGNANISTNQIRHWVKTWKAEKAPQTLTQFPDGSAKLNGTIRNDLTRPQWLEWDYSRKIRRLFDIGFTVYDVENLPKFLKPLHIADKFVLTDGNIQMVFPVGTVKKSLAHFQGNTLFSVGKDACYYLVITKEGATDYDVIPALSIDPKGHDFPEIMMDFKVDEPFDLESAENAPTLDASKQGDDDTTPVNEAPKTQENATQDDETKPAEKTTSAGAAVVLSSDDLRGDNFGKTLESVKNALTQGAKQEQKKEATWDGFLNQSKEVWINIAMNTGRFPMKVIYFPAEKIAIVKHKKTWYAIEAITGSAFYTMPNFYDLLNTLRHPENRTPILALIESVRSKNPALNPIDEEGDLLDISPAEYEKMQAEKQAEGPLQGEEEKQGEKQEEKAPEQETTQEKRVKIAPVESSAPLATVTPAEPAERPSVRASEPAPVESAPLPSEPSRADEPSGAEKPFEIGTYTTKKGKIKTSIKFFQPPTPSQIDALKRAFYWEYNGTWNGSPRKLPDIFKH